MFLISCQDAEAAGSRDHPLSSKDLERKLK